MEPLATIDALEARGITVDDADRADNALADISALVRAYTGQTFTLVTDDLTRIRTRNGEVRLPQRPVVDVTAVATVDGSTVDYVWDAGEVVFLSGFGVSLNSFEVEPFRNRATWLDVTYSHGYATTPDDILAVVCGLAAKALAREPTGADVTQESAGPFSRSFSTSSMALGVPERSILDRYRRPIGLIQVSP